VRCNREEADGRFGGRLLQVKFIKRQKDAKLPLDELTVMELLDPVRRVADVKEMAGYMGIDPKKEMHLMWVAKMCVLDDLPGGWHEEATPDGTLTYVNAHTGQRTYEHPTERAFKELLERERKKRPPYQSLMPEYYENPPARYREDRTQEGEVLRTEIRPASGTYLDFRDVYGRQFWVDMLTDHVTMDFYLIRQGAAALKVQAIWKGLQVRRQIWEMHVACATIARAWNKYQFDRILKQINKQRLKSTIKIQEAWRLCRLRWACSRQMYKLLGAIGGRPGRAANKRVDGLLHSNYSFVSVHRAVVHLQRSLRETLKRHARAHI